MKTYAIKNDYDSTGKIYGILFYYENEDVFQIEIPGNIDYWEAPPIMDSFIKRGKLTVDTMYSRKWVENRIVPPERQNIGMILRDNHLDHYDEFKLLLKGTGRCAQDDFYIEKTSIDEIPAEIRQRVNKNIECFYRFSENSFIFFLKSGETLRLDYEQTSNDELLRFKRLFSYYNPALDLSVAAGGGSLRLGLQHEVTRETILSESQAIPFSLSDFRALVSNALVTTDEAAQMLNCSRQNIDSLVKRGKLTPVKESPKGKVFLKQDVVARVKNYNANSFL